MPGSFEDKLKAADEAFILKPSAGSWIGLQKKLGSQRKLYWICLIPFLAVIGGGIFWLARTNESIDEKNNIKPSRYSKSKTPPSLPQVLANLPPPIKTASNTYQPNIIPKPKAEIVNTIRAMEVETNGYQIETSSVPIPPEMNDQSELLFLISRSVSFTIIPNLPEMIPIVFHYPAQLRIIDQLVQPAFTNKLELGFVINAGKSGLKDMAKSKSALTASNPSINTENPKTKPMSVLGLGIRINYFPKSRLFVSSGIGLQQMSVIYEVSKINNPVNNTILWKSNKTNSPDISEYKNQVNYLEIPLLAGLSFNKGKIGFQVASGFAFRYAVSSHFLQRYRAQIDPDLFDFASPNWGAMRRNQYTWKARVAVNYQLNKSSAINLETGFNRHLNTLLNYSDTKFRDINLGLGYTVRF